MQLEVGDIIERKPSVYSSKKTYTVLTKTPHDDSISYDVTDGKVEYVLYSEIFTSKKEYDKAYLHYKRQELFTDLTIKIIDQWGIKNKEIHIILEKYEFHFRNLLLSFKKRDEFDDLFEQLYILIGKMHSLGYTCSTGIVHKIKKDKTIDYKLLHLDNIIDRVSTMNLKNAHLMILENYKDVFMHIFHHCMDSPTLPYVISNIKKFNDKLRNLYRGPKSSYFEVGDHNE